MRDATFLSIRPPDRCCPGREAITDTRVKGVAVATAIASISQKASPAMTRSRALQLLFSFVSLPPLIDRPLPAQTADSAPVAIKATFGLQPNLVTNIARPLRYRPDNGDFVIENGPEFFNRSLYGGNTAFRVDGGDKPEFVMYLPGRGGNLRLGIRSSSNLKWLKDATRIVTRYRPGELIYEIQDAAFGRKAVVTVEVLAYANTEGLIVRATAKDIVGGSELIWAYGGVNGQRGARDGDIGTERVPISQYFQFQPAFAADNAITVGAEGFTLKSAHATIAGVGPVGGRQHVADAEKWNDLPALLSDSAGNPAHQIIVGTAPLSDRQPLFLSLQRMSDGADAGDLNIYADVTTRKSGKPRPQARSPLLPVFQSSQLEEQFAATAKHFDDLRNKVRIETPDPFLDAAMGSLNVVADALWDSNAKAIMHGSIAWRTKLLGWRGPYVLDELGWHERARENFETWLPNQNTDAVPASTPAADPRANLARNEPGLHSNGDLSNSHYDMNMVFIDELLRHLLWTGDKAYAVKVWPVMERHIAWEKRLFRREYGPEKLPLYEAYATIWASDDLYYSGGGSAYASAYNVYANRMAARIAVMAGKDSKPYSDEADKIEKAMRALLWLPSQGTFAEYKDILGKQLVHADYGLWNFYHTVDEQAVTAREAWQMGVDLKTHLRAIPVEGPGVPKNAPYHVLSETDWMPYSWSINNVVMDENMHTALALWEGGHSEDAYVLAKSSLLASMYMGISPGNVGTMDLYDAYRRESQRDFGDSAGIMSRAIVEGLFGVHPDALAGTLTISPGFPSTWTRARLTHPDLGVAFARTGKVDNWEITQPGSRFQAITLEIPAAFTGVTDVQVNGRKAQWLADPDAVGRPMLQVRVAATSKMEIHIVWRGDKVTAAMLSSIDAAQNGRVFAQMTRGAFKWWAISLKQNKRAIEAVKPFNWQKAPTGNLESVDLTGSFNDRATAIFATGKYRSPRSPGVSLALPSQGVGAWAGHLSTLPVIDDTGLRKVAAAHKGKLTMPNGVFFATPYAAAANNIAFTSQWDNYPHEIAIPLDGHARHAYFLMAGSTNFMQSRMDNGELVVTYADGSSTRLPLRNPETWWPIEQDYFIDDYQFPFDAPLPPRVDLKTGEIRLLNLATFKGKGHEVPGGAATVLDLPLDPAKLLRSVTVRAIANDVVIGLMSLTLERP